MGSLTESITKDAMQDFCGRKQGFAKRTAKMRELGIINGALQRKLDCLWEDRNREHLFLIARRPGIRGTTLSSITMMP